MLTNGLTVSMVEYLAAKLEKIQRDAKKLNAKNNQLLILFRSLNKTKKPKKRLRKATKAVITVSKFTTSPYYYKN
jgi:hypothetical protein